MAHQASAQAIRQVTLVVYIQAFVRVPTPQYARCGSHTFIMRVISCPYALAVLYVWRLTRAATSHVVTLWPCPHDTFPTRARSIATSSRPVPRVHTGATGTLVPVSRDRDMERAGAIDRDRLRPVNFVVWTLDRALAPARDNLTR